MIAGILSRRGRFAPSAATNRFRVARAKAFEALVDRVVGERGQCRVLDVGGTGRYWRTFGLSLTHKTTITVTDIENVRGEPDTDWLKFVTADARSMAQFDSGSFDLVHSNSLIEHVGSWDAMRAVACEIRRLAPYYWVQTPDFWCPVEPHFRTLFIHWLPRPVQASMHMRRDRGWHAKAKDIDEATRSVHYALLLDVRQMAYLFPDAAIERECVLGLPKSIIAVKRPAA